jgi:hypothetical protein
MPDKTIEQRVEEAKAKGIAAKIFAYCERCKKDTVYAYAYTQPGFGPLPEIQLYDCMGCKTGSRMTLSYKTLTEKLNGKVVE